MTPTQTPTDIGNHQGHFKQPRRFNQPKKKQFNQPITHRFKLASQSRHIRLPVESPRSIGIRKSRNHIQKFLKRLDEHELFGQSFFKMFFREFPRRGCRPSTVRGCAESLFQFLVYAKQNGQSSLETLTRDDVSGYVEHMQDRGLALNTVSTRLKWVYSFLTYLVDNEVVNPKLVKKKIQIKIPDSLPRAMDPEDVQALLSVLSEPRAKAIILVLLRTGMRIGELLDTRVEDVNMKEKKIDIYEAMKNRVGRVVHISDDAREALTVWLKTRNQMKQYLFYGKKREILSYECARTMFHKHIEKAGLSHKDYTPHCLRHTCASELLNAGMRLECLQQLLGHSNIEMTRRYARLTDNTRKEEYFRAMRIIEKGGINGHYRRDYRLPKAPKETQLLTPHD